VHKINSVNELRSISIIGVGLLGGSIGLAFRAAGGLAERVGVGRRRSSITRAISVGAIDRGTVSHRAGLRNADLAIVCTPIGRFEAVFRQLAEHLPDGAIVTDVGSTKAHVMEAAARLLPPRLRFVGSHPMAGSENAGVDFARADLFQRAQCLVVPPEQDPDPAAVDLVESFWQMLGMRTARIEAFQHDMLVAQISHLPHVVASALIQVATEGGSLDMAASGFQDTTRVASGHPQMWLDILMTNRQGIAQAIDQLILRLKDVQLWLRDGKSEPIGQFLDEAKRVRDAWIQRRYAEREIEP
jgi:prephenate dehydrogenase